MTENAGVRDVPVEDLLEQHRPMLLKFCSFNVPGFDREDLFQELCVTLLKCRNGFKGGRAKFSTYLYTALQNRVWSLNAFWRRRQPVWHQQNPVDPDQAEVEAVDPLAEQDFEAVELRDLRGRLSPEAGAVFDRVVRRGLRVRKGDAAGAAEVREALGFVNDSEEVSG